MAAFALPHGRTLDLDEAALARLASLGVLHGTSRLANDAAKVLSLDWPELEHALPDGGLPRGVIEIASPVVREGDAYGMHGGATTIALSAIRAAHAADAKAWCAWVTVAGAPSLYAPAVAQASVDLDRLLVVRPDAAALARTVVKVAASGAFDVVVIDAQHPAGLDGRIPGEGKTSRSRIDGSVVVRKLALASEEKGTAFLVLTNVYAPRAVPWPVALRLEVERRPEAIALRITKDRRGRSASQRVVRVSA
ncbi:MAG: recombinase A [Deltaproteobacteria bacterium]|nr:recombinase A [Deltaproteobacteria bacterium]